MLETILIIIGGLFGWLLLEFLGYELPGLLAKTLFGPTEEEEREYAERVAAEERAQRASLYEDFQAYVATYAWLRADVRVVKIRNRQRKVQFDLFLETTEGTFAVEKMLGPLSQCDAGNRQLCAEIEICLIRETEPAWIAKLEPALALLRDDRQRIEDLVRAIRPFVDLPPSFDAFDVAASLRHQARLSRAQKSRES